ncbi:hypothetical protein [Nocardioides sp.]|uniref:hypothetical protein n=1 Tax=Nocardioides sp. TaxID=35761 RepID=UPI002D136212|nr:hypothetical protein [Nocardioides sp.]HXH79615.1 hypothetical protein [Nocardioides sp.]
MRLRPAGTHGGDATTVIVAITLDGLRTDLAAAGLLGGGLVPGDDNIGDTLSAAQARRLACSAKIIPAVLGGKVRGPRPRQGQASPGPSEVTPTSSTPCCSAATITIAPTTPHT